MKLLDIKYTSNFNSRENELLTYVHTNFKNTYTQVFMYFTVLDTNFMYTRILILIPYQEP